MRGPAGWTPRWPGSRATRHKVAAGLAVLLLGTAIPGVVLHHLGSTWPPVLAGAAFAPVLCALAVPALVLGVVGRSGVVVAGSLTTLALVLAQNLPLFVPDGRAPAGPRLRILAQNLEFGRAEAHSLVRAVRDGGVDVLMTVETTAESVSRLRDSGLADLLPHAELRDRPGAAGVTIWSRCPLTDPVAHAGFALGVLSVRLDCPEGDAVGVAVHPIAPVFDADTSVREAELLREVLAGIPGDRPVIVAGDFNATWGHLRFRSLRELGYVLSVDGGGDGYRATWPSGRRYPPILPIDHVLARGAAWIGETRTVDLPGTDHRGVAATVVLEKSA